ncbi:MAG TPA: hypothetical protein VFQ43_07560 [Nitrososphaera sp.]|nr:hypothetical protein [Nitrososphaera sp.]
MNPVTPLGALVNAVGQSMGGAAGFVIETDPSLPNDVILLVVGPKPPFWESER